MTDSNAETRKRSRSPEPKIEAEAKVKKEYSDVDMLDDDEEPVPKKARRGNPKIEEDDEDEEEPQPMKKKSKTKPDSKPKSEAKSKSSKAPASPPKKVKKEETEESSPASSKRRDSSASATRSEAESEVEGEEEEDEKPEVAAKVRERFQTTLKSKAKDPYPDWKAGDPVPYAALCTTFSLVELTRKRLEITAHCSLFLRQVLRLTPDDMTHTVHLMIGKLGADYAGIELGIGESLIMKAIGESTGRSLQVVKSDQRKIGDLGLVAVASRGKQPTMFKPKPLTVRGVHKGLMEIATVTGNGSQGRKVDGIKKLLSAADGNMKNIDINKDKGGPSEAKFIVRFLEGKLRLGLAGQTVLVALAQAMVCHEVEQKGGGKVPSTDQLAKGEAILKEVYR